MFYPKQKRRTGFGRKRKGAAAVEFAVCLPVMMIIVFGSIEAASMLFLRQTMVQAAYESVKVAIRPNTTTSDATAAGIAVTNGRQLNGVSITFVPSDVSLANPGDPIRVTVSAPGDSNSLIRFGPFKNRTVAATAVMVKE